MASISVLGLDVEQPSTWLSCGSRLTYCPTFRVTGEEKHLPRGRIDAMHTVDDGTLRGARRSGRLLPA